MFCMHAFARISCIILSAGSSFRMGEHKALLGFGNSGATFLEKITATYADSGIGKVVVVVSGELNEKIGLANLNLSENVHLVVNHHPEKGRFFSLKTGMAYIEEGFSVFLQNVDNPFIYPDLLTAMVRVEEDGEVIMPVCQGKAGHPVLMNHRVCKAVAEECNPEIRIDQFLSKFRRIPVLTDHDDILININTPGDYALAFP